MIRPRQAVQQASLRSRAISPASASRRTADSVQRKQAVAKRLELADDIRARGTKQKRVDEPAAIRVLAECDVASLDHLLEARDGVLDGLDDVP